MFLFLENGDKKRKQMLHGKLKPVRLYKKQSPSSAHINQSFVFVEIRDKQNLKERKQERKKKPEISGNISTWFRHVFNLRNMSESVLISAVDSPRIGVSIQPKLTLTLAKSVQWMELIHKVPIHVLIVGKGNVASLCTGKNFFYIFNFLKSMATKGDCFPLSSVTEFFSPFPESHDGTKLATEFLSDF